MLHLVYVQQLVGLIVVFFYAIEKENDRLKVIRSGKCVCHLRCPVDATLTVVSALCCTR